MDEKMMVNEGLFITESEAWTYFSVGEKIFKLKTDEEQIQNIYKVLELIRLHKFNMQEETDGRIRAYEILKCIGGLIPEKEKPAAQKKLNIKGIGNLKTLEFLRTYCREESIDFQGEKEGVYAYLTEEEVILSKKEIKDGRFVCPNVLQQELLVQALLKNMEEIQTALEKYNFLSVPLYAYVAGVRGLMEKINTVEGVSNYLGFQSWKTEISVDTDHFYPKVEMKCRLKNKIYHAVDENTDNALFRIYQEYIAEEEKETYEG